jgi:hypothetical protein
MIDFDKAMQAGIVTPAQAQALRRFYAEASQAPPAPLAAPARFDLPHVLWYGGALLIIGAMSWFTTLGFSRMGGGFLATVGALYALAALALGEHLWSRRGLKTPGGLFVAVAVAMAPLVVYGLQAQFGWWDAASLPGTYKDFHVWIKGGWVPMEIATLAAAALAIRRYPFGFIAFVAAVALWYFTMDLAQYLAGHADGGWALRRKLTTAFGLATMLIAWAVDLRQRKADYAFWLHLAGGLAFWGGLTAQHSDSELAKFGYCLICLALVGLALLLRRRVYAVFGVAGIAFYLGDVASRLFKDSLVFPFALTFLGLVVVALGLWGHRHGARLAERVDAAAPEWLRRLRPQRRDAPA